MMNNEERLLQEKISELEEKGIKQGKEYDSLSKRRDILLDSVSILSDKKLKLN